MAHAFKFARVDLALTVISAIPHNKADGERKNKPSICELRAWDGERRLLMLTPHDPQSMAVWAFSPFRSTLVSDDHAA
jgi:hypothetical protein